MLLFCGRLPDTKIVTRLRQSEILTRCLCFFAAGALFAPVGYADSSAPLSLAEAEMLALTEEPGQRAMLTRAEALKEQSVAAGQLPDPKIRLGLANYPLESGGFGTEGMTQIVAGIHQAFPPGDSRNLRTRRLQLMATELEHSAGVRERDVVYATRHAWLEIYYWERAHELISTSRPFFQDLVAVAESLYSVGRKNQHDVLSAELELSRLNDRLLKINEQRFLAQAALSEWVGEESARPLASALPAWSALPDLETLQAQVLNHPLLTAARARIETLNTGVRLAEQAYKPGWALDLGYGYRDGVLPNGRSRSDFVSLSVTVDLPLFRKNRQSRMVSAAFSERSAADATWRQLQRQLNSQLRAEYARWQELTQRLDLYERVILEQSTERAQAAMQAYQSDAGDFADVMRGHIDDLNLRFDHIRLQVDRAQSFARIDSLTGVGP